MIIDQVLGQLSQILGQRWGRTQTFGSAPQLGVALRAPVEREQCILIFGGRILAAPISRWALSLFTVWVVCPTPAIPGVPKIWSDLTLENYEIGRNLEFSEICVKYFLRFHMKTIFPHGRITKKRHCKGTWNPWFDFNIHMTVCENHFWWMFSHLNKKSARFIYRSNSIKNQMGFNFGNTTVIHGPVAMMKTGASVNFKRITFLTQFKPHTHTPLTFNHGN